MPRLPRLILMPAWCVIWFAAIVGVGTMLWAPALPVPARLVGLIAGPVDQGATRLDQITPFVQATAIRPLVGLAAISFALVSMMLAVGVIVRARAPALVALAGSLVVAAIAVAPAVQGAQMLGTGSGDSPGPRRTASDSLTVVSANTLGSAARLPSVGRFAARASADVVVLPESSPRVVAGLIASLPGGATRWQALSAGGIRAPASGIIVRRALRPRLDIARDVGTDYALARARFTFRGRPLSVLAAHTVAPRRGRTSVWGADLRELRGACSPNTIIAGDLNATVDHSLVRAIADAGCPDVLGPLAGTWPTKRRRALRTRIDHILAPAGWRPEAAGTAPVPGSDHDLVWARLRRSG